MNTVLGYHERSKHHLSHYAPGPGHLDWATQPDPFRRFAGAPQVDLPLLAGELPACWDDLFRPGAVPPRPFDFQHLAHLLELSLGLSAWKSYGGSRWALRCNPSSGNLHPTEGYLISPALPGLTAGVYHYQPEQHRLELRASVPFAWSGGVLLALTGIHWREAWKYGVRAFRYCQHDCGHAVAALGYAAAALGWPAQLLTGWGDGEIATLTGVDRWSDFEGAEDEEPEAILWIGNGTDPEARTLLPSLAKATWYGQANALSPSHRHWPEIPLVTQATRKPPHQPLSCSTPPPLPPLASASHEPVSHLIRRRRSAQAFDGVTALPASVLFRLLDGLVPRAGQPPWTLLATPPAVNLVLFLHRVAGLTPGIYCLVRDLGQLTALRAGLSKDWRWAPVPGCPDHLALFLLAPLDARQLARTLSCHQDIAADSTFSLAMLARMDDLTEETSWMYRFRLLECGILGQVLYLSAEAAGLQGTGIGCYFDDLVHQVLGIQGQGFQDLYHFTLGRARVDTRLVMEPAYPHIPPPTG